MVRPTRERLANPTEGGPVDVWRRYRLAVSVTALAFLARWLLNPVLLGDSPFSIFILAVLVSAWRGGLGPGLVSLGLGAVSATFFFLYPQHSFQFPGSAEFVHFLVFAAIGTSVCLLGERMRSALEAAEAATRAKGAFMAYMSHEIRTPLNGVLGMLELLGRTGLDGRQERYAHRARDSAELLLSLLNDVLDFTKIELGRFELEEIEYRPAAVLASVEGMFAASTEQKGLRFQCRPAPEVSDLVGLGDPARLRQVLINLVGNAVKFTDRGEVVVSATLEDGEPAVQHLRFEVRDTGIGIESAIHERLFRPFTQADSSMSRRFGGSGLGLAICRELARMMGGTIDFESTPGEGSTFWFVIPFREASSVEPALAAEASRPSRRDPSRASMNRGNGSRRVLVVEDNPINAEVAVTLLRDSGYPCDLAGSGPEAIEKVAAGGYDLVLMDCQLPGLDGFETTRRIRRGGGRLPILALTASATGEVRERCVEAGMDACLSKPIGAADLLDAVFAALEGLPAAQAPSSVENASSTVVADLDAALRRLDGMEGLLARLANQFLAGSDEAIGQIRESSRARNATALGLAAHRLKGQAATFDAAVVVESAARLESLAPKADWPKIEAELARLETALPALVEELSAYWVAHST